ncbi:hypothetical protein OPV22_012123 [Ensete ventricosum]|uniref:Uncharacterized protein n=1 Tax=Ensete ventricosum TaxID=4639 RepID=A0AAV8QSI5_ENSVE|nr:hypothetical protein OPV22_012123 [Ensete ventricosum]
MLVTALSVPAQLPEEQLDRKRRFPLLSDRSDPRRLFGSSGPFHRHISEESPDPAICGFPRLCFPGEDP